MFRACSGPLPSSALCPQLLTDLSVLVLRSAFQRKRWGDVDVRVVATNHPLATHAPERLRAAQTGSNAPALDLASYGVRAARGPLALQAGHLALGNHRMLASQFRTRGVAADVRVGPRVSLSVGSAAGSEIVGWTDVLGLARPTHRIVTGVLGIEGVPAHPAAASSLMRTARVPWFTQSKATLANPARASCDAKPKRSKRLRVTPCPKMTTGKPPAGASPRGTKANTPMVSSETFCAMLGEAHGPRTGAPPAIGFSCVG